MIARRTSFTYKGSDTDAKTVAAELGTVIRYTYQAGKAVGLQAAPVRELPALAGRVAAGGR